MWKIRKISIIWLNTISTRDELLFILLEIGVNKLIRSLGIIMQAELEAH